MAFSRNSALCDDLHAPTTKPWLYAFLLYLLLVRKKVEEAFTKISMAIVDTRLLWGLAAGGHFCTFSRFGSRRAVPMSMQIVDAGIGAGTASYGFVP